MVLVAMATLLFCRISKEALWNKRCISSVTFLLNMVMAMASQEIDMCVCPLSLVVEQGSDLARKFQTWNCRRRRRRR
jgi:hypothetical protein